MFLKWALIFFVLSVIAGFFGFSGVAAGSAGIAKVLFSIFAIGVIVFLILGFLIVNNIQFSCSLAVFKAKAAADERELMQYIFNVSAVENYFSMFIDMFYSLCFCLRTCLNQMFNCRMHIFIIRNVRNIFI